MALQSFSLHASLRAPERIWRPRPIERSLASTYRNRERKRRTRAELTLHPDPPTVEFDEFPPERQPQTSSLSLLVRRAHLPELFEDGSLVLRGNPHPGISHRDLGHAIHNPRPHLHPATFWGELQGARQEVQEDLLDLSLVAANLTQALVHRVDQGNSAPTGPLPNQD